MRVDVEAVRLRWGQRIRDLKWYTGASGGISIATGSVTPPHAQRDHEPLCIEQRDQLRTNSGAGPAQHHIGVGATAPAARRKYLVFNVYSEHRPAVDQGVFPTQPRVVLSPCSIRIFDLRTTTVPLVNGTNTVTLNWSILPGDFYRIQSSGTGMYYNTAGVFLPYNYPGLLQIHNSSGGHGQYYYFYDWQGAAPISSRSARGLW